MSSQARFVVLALLAAAASACGKIGDPLPPIVPVPRPVTDLSVTQTGYDLVFRWTNPASYIDETPAAGLTRATIRSGGAVVLDVPATGPGEIQTATLPGVRDRAGSTASFSIEIAGGGGRSSEPSPPVLVDILEAPGPPTDLRATVDQGAVVLEWGRPLENPGLAAAFRVYRDGAAVGEVPADAAGFEDRRYAEGGAYVYRVVGLRGLLEGIASADLEVVAVDRTPPLAPGAPSLRQVDDDVVVTWPPSPETDLAGYRLWARDGQDGPFAPLGADLLAGTLYTDASGAAVRAYAVTAVDRSGNESPLSPPAP